MGSESRVCKKHRLPLCCTGGLQMGQVCSRIYTLCYLLGKRHDTGCIVLCFKIIHCSPPTTGLCALKMEVKSVPSL